MIFLFDFSATDTATINPAPHYAEWNRVFLHFIIYFPAGNLSQSLALKHTDIPRVVLRWCNGIQSGSATSF
jgi:hypothetical protein